MESMTTSDLRTTEKRTRDIEQAVHNIVSEKCCEIDSIIAKIRVLLKDETTELTDLELEDIILQLPILLYDCIEAQEIVGVQYDVSNQIYKEAQSEAYRLARGTISDKNAIADLNTRMQQLEKILYERSYKIIKQKLEMAVETLNATKKIQASRQQKYDLSKYNRFGT